MVGQSGNERPKSDLPSPAADRQPRGPAAVAVPRRSPGPSLKSLSVLGFLTVLDAPPHGLFGGYLIVNPSGRPLEFHCTEPVKPSRAQQILYGPTLAPFLYAEQIGQTLFTKARQTAPLVLTDVVPALDLRSYIDVPVVLVPTDDGLSDSSAGLPFDSAPPRRLSVAPTRVDVPHVLTPHLVTVQVAQQRVALAADQDKDLDWLERELGAVAQRLDLAEPFARIREAICEAQRIQQDD